MPWRPVVISITPELNKPLRGTARLPIDIKLVSGIRLVGYYIQPPPHSIPGDYILNVPEMGTNTQGLISNQPQLSDNFAVVTDNGGSSPLWEPTGYFQYNFTPCKMSSVSIEVKTTEVVNGIVTLKDLIGIVPDPEESDPAKVITIYCKFWLEIFTECQ